MKPMKRVYVLVELEVEKDIKDLTDKVAQRTYTLDGVWDTTAKLLTGNEALTIAGAWMDHEKKVAEEEILSAEVDTEKAREGHWNVSGAVFVGKTASAKGAR